MERKLQPKLRKDLRRSGGE